MPPVKMRGDGRKAKNPKQTFARLLGYIKPYKWRMVGMVICIILSTVASVVSNGSLNTLIEDIIKPMLGQTTPSFTPLVRFLGMLACIYATGMLASFLQYMLPGAPSLYYADEAGMEGYKDPFNRRTYPWNNEDPQLLRHFRCLGKLRKEHNTLRLGSTRFFRAWGSKLGFTRALDGKQVKIYLNCSQTDWEIPGEHMLYGHNLRTVAPGYLNVAPMGFCITQEE